MPIKAINPTAAVSAYFNRIEQGVASEEEYRILPQMLDRYENTADADACGDPNAEKFDGMSESGKRGYFPDEGLVNAHEIARFIGKSGLKNPCESLMKMVRDGKFPPPVNPGGRPLLWLAQTVREWMSGLKPGRKAA